MFQVVCFLAVIIGSYVTYKKYNDKSVLWYFFLGIAALLLTVWGYVADDILLLPEVIGFASDIASIVMGVVIILLFIGIGIKQTLARRKGIGIGDRHNQ